jgi:NitT/TauT family transport system substrate-binding protein
VALRSFVRDAGLKTTENGGNVTILPTANADTLTLFKKGDIQGAWAPEPWATRLILEAGGKVFVDEKTLWPNGDFVTTHLIVSTGFLKKNPDAVERLVRANVKVSQFINENPDRAKEITNKAILDLTGQGLSTAVIDSAWKNLRFTYDPIASSLNKSARDAFDAGLLGSKVPNLKGIYSLEILNRVLAELKLPAVKE